LKEGFIFLIIIFYLSLLSIAETYSQVDTLWVKTFWNPINQFNYDYGNSVQQTIDGGYIVTGFASGSTSGIQLLLIKTDSSGDTIWTKAFNMYDGNVGNSVQQTQDGGYIIAGDAESDLLLMKTDSLGDTLWTKIFGTDTSGESGRMVKQTMDSGYIITGKRIFSNSNDLNQSDVLLVKTNSDGDALWSKTYGGSNSDQGNSIQQTKDGGYIIIGDTESYGSGYQSVWLIKTDSLGNTLWTKTYGSEGTDFGNSVQQTQDGGYIFTGSIDAYGNSQGDLLLTKTDGSGNVQWIKLFGGKFPDGGNSIQITSDNGYIILGYTYSSSWEMLLLKTNEFGDSLWAKTFDFGYWSKEIQQTTDGGYVIVGETTSPFGDRDIILIKTTPDITNDLQSTEKKVTDYLLAQNFPNPFNPSTNIIFSIAEESYVTLEIFNELGEKVYALISQELTTGNYKYNWNAENLPSGVYFYQLQAGSFVETKKMILMK
jgi:hypothetical protein